MSIKEQIHVILGVLKDWRVIVTAVAMILVIMFVKFITNYKKKPPKPAAAKPAPAAPAPNADASKDGKKEDANPKSDISEKDV